MTIEKLSYLRCLYTSKAICITQWRYRLLSPTLVFFQTFVFSQAITGYEKTNVESYAQAPVYPIDLKFTAQNLVFFYAIMNRLLSKRLKAK